MSLRPIGPEAGGPPPAPPARRAPGLRPVSALPPRAKLFLAVALVALIGFVVWLTDRLFQLDSEAVAILLSVLSCIGAIAVGSAVLTLTRIAFSLGAMPYLLGRGLRRLLTGRRR